MQGVTFVNYKHFVCFTARKQSTRQGEVTAQPCIDAKRQLTASIFAVGDKRDRQGVVGVQQQLGVKSPAGSSAAV